MVAREPRQERAELRRDALLAAAVEVIAERGPGAFSARAVAAQSGLPLAAVSYYFPQLDDLFGAAVVTVLDGWLASGQRGAMVEMRSRNGVAAATVAITAALLPGGSPATIRIRYEHLLAAAGNPVAATAMARLRPRLAELIGEILDSTGVSASISPDAIISLVDGAAVGAVSEGEAAPRSRVERVLLEVLGRT